MTNEPDHALDVARLLDDQLDLWQRHLPNTFGQGHWHIIGYVRPYGDVGVSLKRIFHHVAGVFGMDISTCNKRLKELFSSGLLVPDDESLRRSTLITATPQLIDKYDAYVVDVANLMIGLVSDTFPRPLVVGSGGLSLNQKVNGFYERLARISEPLIDGFLRSKMKSAALRDKAVHCLHTFSHWRMLSLAWRSRAEGRDHLLSDDFHMKVYPITGRGASTTRECLQDLIDWGFLERLSKMHGVRANRFAVRITEDAYNLFDSIFGQSYDVLVAVSGDIVNRFASGTSLQSTVVPITRGANRNVSGTSLEGDAAAPLKLPL